MDIHVSNLSFKATEEQLRGLFESFGTVSQVNIVVDRRTRLKRGYGFVKMPNKLEAEVALIKLKGVELDGRPLKLAEADSIPGGKKAPKPYKGKRGFKKKLKLVTFDNEKTVAPKKRKKRQGAGRGTKY